MHGLRISDAELSRGVGDPEMFNPASAPAVSFRRQAIQETMAVLWLGCRTAPSGSRVNCHQ